MGIGRSIKSTFWRGLAALLPALLTVIVLAVGINLVYTYAGYYVNGLVIYIVAWSTGQDVEVVRTWYDEHLMGWVGVVVAVMLLIVVAYLVGAFLGATLTRLFERWIMHVPLMRRIYPGAKQVSEFFFAEKKVEFRRVVMVEFPRKGMWMVGFVTGRGFMALSEKLGADLVSVFVPATPAPVTGYVVTVAKSDVVDLPITVDEAIQYLISAGVIMPMAERDASLAELGRAPETCVREGPDED
jgi:uncharacterized membrane protein